MPGYDGGVTALCTLALLNSGVPADDPNVSTALNYLRGLELDKTYVVSLQTMVLCAAEPKKDMLDHRATCSGSKRTKSTKADRNGAWSYPGPGGDNSNSQFAVLALYDAQRVGVEVSRAHLATRRRLLAQHAKRRRLLGLRARRLRHRQHDLRRHRRPRHLHRRTRIGRRRRRKRPRHLLPPTSARRCKLDRAIDWLGRSLLGEPQSAPRRRRPGLPLLLSLRPRAQPAASPLIASSAITIGIAKGPSI